MKCKKQIIQWNNAANMSAPKSQKEHECEPPMNTDSLIDVIHLQANYVGPMLEEILRAHNEPAALLD